MKNNTVECNKWKFTQAMRNQSLFHQGLLSMRSLSAINAMVAPGRQQKQGQDHRTRKRNKEQREQRGQAHAFILGEPCPPLWGRRVGLYSPGSPSPCRSLPFGRHLFHTWRIAAVASSRRCRAPASHERGQRRRAFLKASPSERDRPLAIAEAMGICLPLFV